MAKTPAKPAKKAPKKSPPKVRAKSPPKASAAPAVKATLEAVKNLKAKPRPAPPIKPRRSMEEIQAEKDHNAALYRRLFVTSGKK